MSTDQRGQVLMELVLVIALAIAAGVWSVTRWDWKVEQARIAAMATWLQQLRSALQADRVAGDVLARRVLEKGQLEVSEAVGELKQLSLLSDGFPSAPPMDYRVLLTSIESRRCQGSDCSQDILLAALPGSQIGRADVQRFAADLLLALEGRAAVSGTGDGELLGPDMQYEGVRVAGQLLPAGTVAMLLWKQTWPYVRLHEDRPVRLDGDVTFGGKASVLGQLHVSDGIIIEKTVRAADGCHHANQVAILDSGELVVCRSGQWLQQPGRQADLRPCNKPPKGSVLWEYFRMRDSSEPDPEPCKCDENFVMRFVGRRHHSIRGVKVYKGYVCERL